MKLTTHNVEQAGRGIALYELARRGYVVQFTDSRFPTEDLLIVSPNGFHFGVDVKGQRTKNFWRMKEPVISDQFFFFLVYIDVQDGKPDLFILPSNEMNQLWHDYRNRILETSGKDSGIWGVNWATPKPYKDNWLCLPE